MFMKNWRKLKIDCIFIMYIYIYIYLYIIYYIYWQFFFLQSHCSSADTQTHWKTEMPIWRKGSRKRLFSSFKTWPMKYMNVQYCVRIQYVCNTYTHNHVYSEPKLWKCKTSRNSSFLPNHSTQNIIKINPEWVRFAVNASIDLGNGNLLAHQTCLRTTSIRRISSTSSAERTFNE